MRIEIKLEGEPTTGIYVHRPVVLHIVMEEVGMAELDAVRLLADVGLRLKAGDAGRASAPPKSFGNQQALADMQAIQATWTGDLEQNRQRRLVEQARNGRT